MRRAQYVWFLSMALCTVFTVFTVFAGSAGAQTFEAGVKGGIAVTSIPLAGEVFDQVAGQTSRDSSSKVGLTAGAYIGFPFAKNLLFQPEALFVMKGVKLSETTGGTFSARTYYIDVPLLVKLRMRASSRTPIYVLGGPNFGSKLGSSAKLDTPGKTLSLDINPALKTLDLGLAFGAGIERGRYLYEARFTAGLTDIAAASYPHPDALHNRTFSVMFGRQLH
jgi:hypothetical protein